MTFDDPEYISTSNQAIEERKIQQFEEYKKTLYLGTTQEEAAELIQSISKINRFGLNSTNPYAKTSNRANLVSELGDVLAMIELLKDVPYLGITEEELQEAKAAKIKKMTYWLHNPANKAD